MYKKKDTIQGLVFITPAIIILGIFVFASIVFSVIISFYRVNLFTGEATFIGLENYQRIFSDSKSRIAFINTISFVAVVVPIQTFLALVIASVLNAKIRGRLQFRIIYFLPTLTSSAALTMIFMFLFSLTGPVNQIAMLLGILNEPINFLQNANFALQVIMAMNIWSTIPFFMSIYLAGLQEIPETLYESAKVDGASTAQQF